MVFIGHHPGFVGVFWRRAYIKGDRLPQTPPATTPTASTKGNTTLSLQNWWPDKPITQTAPEAAFPPHR
ncbi:MAG: hypothetical protein U1F42_10070 [Candidatus Competibacteraceae bacterium]